MTSSSEKFEVYWQGWLKSANRMNQTITMKDAAKDAWLIAFTLGKESRKTWDAVYSGVVSTGIRSTPCGQGIYPEYCGEFNSFWALLTKAHKDNLGGRIEFYREKGVG